MKALETLVQEGRTLIAHRSADKVANEVKRQLEQQELFTSLLAAFREAINISDEAWEMLTLEIRTIGHTRYLIVHLLDSTIKIRFRTVGGISFEWPHEYIDDTHDQSFRIFTARAYKHYEKQRAEALDKLIHIKDFNDLHVLPDYLNAYLAIQKECPSQAWGTDEMRQARILALRSILPNNWDNLRDCDIERWLELAGELGEALENEIAETQNKLQRFQAINRFLFSLRVDEYSQCDRKELEQVAEQHRKLAIDLKVDDAAEVQQALKSLERHIDKLVAEEEREEKRQQLEQDSFYPFRYYIIHYALVAEQDGFTEIDTDLMYTLHPEPDAGGWWTDGHGRKFRITHPVKVERCAAYRLTQIPAYAFPRKLTEYGYIQAPPEGAERL